VITEEIPPSLAGERIDRVVAMLCGCTRAEAHDAVASGLVTIDGRVTQKQSVKVAAGQQVTVSGDPARPPSLPQPDPGVEVPVVFADDTIIVVDKPAGLVVHPGAGNADATLVNGLLARFGDLVGVGEEHRPGIVHRLDKGTSGLMVVARTPDAYHDLVAQLSSHSVQRHYRALVWGRLDTQRGTIDAPIGRSRRDPLRMTISADGRPSRTHYEMLETFVEPVSATLVECRLETGRTHQIRVHLRSIGHPVVGDDMYGGARPQIRMDRPFLHAAHLRFTHPVTGDEVSFDSPLPADLLSVLAQLS
jgi:23S rRNA pseudouridine1911/1915/1917 synthase